MKHLIIYSGIALALLINSNDISFDIKKKGKISQKSRREIIDANRIKTEFPNSNKLFAPEVGIELKSVKSIKGNFIKSKSPKLVHGDEPVASVSINKIDKTTDQLIAEDNAITENNISNETNLLDFDLIDVFYLDHEIVALSNLNIRGKTEEQIFAEDNAITEQNISNKIQPLDYNFINSIALNTEFMESLPRTTSEKTANELIAEDNLITNSNLSNETEPLNFELISKILKT
jgi:hypothetical protein